MLMKRGCPVIVSPQRTTWPSLTSRSASATWTSSPHVRGTLRPFCSSRSFRYTKTDDAGEWPTPYVLPSQRQRLRNASTRSSLGIESARSSTGRRSPFAANETHVIGWPCAASGGERGRQLPFQITPRQSLDLDRDVRVGLLVRCGGLVQDREGLGLRLGLP